MPIRIFSAPIFFAIVLLLPMLLVPAAGRAAEWSIEPSLKLRREYNDNLRLSIHPHESVNGSIVTPALRLGVAGPRWDLGLNAEATQRRYSGEEGLDRDDSALNLTSLYRTERSTWQLNAIRARDSALISESVDADTGTVDALKERQTDTVNPAWTWMYSETTQLQVGLRQTDVTYEEGSLSAGLYDYRYRSASATLGKRLSELNQVFLSGGYSEFHVPATSFDSETLNLQAGIIRNFSETTKGTIQAGQRQTKSVTKGNTLVCTAYLSSGSGVTCVNPVLVAQDIHRERTGSVFSGNLETKTESTDWNFSLSRSLQPSGSGGQVEQDQFQFVFKKRLSPRAWVSINSGVLKVRTQEGNISNSGRTFYDFGPSAYWQWTREWLVGASYRYARVKRVYENESADSNSVNLWVTYKPLKWSISR